MNDTLLAIIGLIAVWSICGTIIHCCDVYNKRLIKAGKMMERISKNENMENKKEM